MESEAIRKIIDQLKRDGKWSDSESGIQLFWMDGWVQLSSHQFAMNFSSTETLAKWLLMHSFANVGQEEIKMPDEGAFMASMDAWSRQGFRPDQKKFDIYYDEMHQVSSWDNYHYQVNKNGVTETWNDFFELDAPAKVQIKKYSFTDYAVEGTNHNVKEYLEAEGLLSPNVHQKRFSFTHNAALFEADQFLKDICEKIIYKLAKKRLKKNYWTELRERYREGGRFYHNLIHIANVYKALTKEKNKIEDWEVLVLAVLYHDIVYDVSRNDNEEQSAVWAERVMLSLKINPHRIERCKAHILATKTHIVSSDPDTNLFTDADLSILGMDPSTYSVYAAQVREEYSIYDDAIYNVGRAKVLSSFLAKPTIYKTTIFQQQFEQQARINIKSELDRLVI